MTADWLSDFYISTIEAYKEELQDNVFQDFAILNALKEKSKVNTIDEGTKLMIPILIGKASGGKAYQYYDSFDITPQAGAVNAEVPWAHYAIPVAVADQEITENMGKAKIFDHVKAKISQSENSLTDIINTAFFAASPTSVEMLSLVSLMPNTATASQSTALMGITPVTGTNTAQWRSKHETAAVASVNTTLSKLWRSCKDGTDKPDLIVTDDLGEQIYEAMLTDPSTSAGVDVGVRYTSTEKGDIGYGSFTYKGAPILVDKSCGQISSTLPMYYFINTKYVGFKMKGITQTEFVRASKQLAKTSFLKCDVQLFTNRRNRLGLAVTS